MNFLEKIIVKNFRNISSADIHLNNFNVLVGANNAGKSNFLQVINFLKFILAGGTNDVKSFFEGSSPRLHSFLIPYKASNLREKGQSVFELIFSNSINNQIYEYEIRIDWEPVSKIETYKYSFKIAYECLTYKDRSRPGPAANIFVREMNKVNYGQELFKTQILEKIPDYASVTRFFEILSLESSPYKDALDSFNKILETKVYYFSNIQLLKEFKDQNSIDSQERVISFDIKNEIIKLNEQKMGVLKKVLNEIIKIEDIHIFDFPLPNPDPKTKDEMIKFVFFSHMGAFKTYEQLSDGSIVLIALLTRILSSNDHIFFIEEPENSLHPKALIQLVNFLKSYSSENQFVIATHSLVLVNNINPDNTIVACVDSTGLTKFENVADMKELKKKLKNSFLDFSDIIFFEINNNEFQELE